MATKAKTNEPAPFKRSGLHRLTCDSCPCYGYLTVAMLEDIGEMPGCLRPGCDGTLMPDRVELALLLGVETLAVRELFDRTEDKERSQLRSLGRRRFERKLSAGTLNDMNVSALAEISAEQREQARQRRMAAILPTPEPLPF